MNTDYRNSPLLNEEEKRLVRAMQRVRAGAGVVVLVGLVVAGLAAGTDPGPDVVSTPYAPARDEAPADPGLAALERGLVG